MLVTSHRMVWLFAIGLVFPLIVATTIGTRAGRARRARCPKGHPTRPTWAMSERWYRGSLAWKGAYDSRG